MSLPPFHGIFSASMDRAAEALSGDLSEKKSKKPKATFEEREEQMPITQQGGQVAVDIYEQESYYIIKAPIAGVRLSDIDIEITDNTITIRGARKQTDDIPQNQYYLQECFWGDFHRSVTLPFAIDPRKVKATFNKECILKILIPKEERVKIVRVSE